MKTFDEAVLDNGGSFVVPETEFHKAWKDAMTFGRGLIEVMPDGSCKHICIMDDEVQNETF
jgi:hypothetical protein